MILVLTTWRFYDLKRDPFELRNFFKKDQNELLNSLSGDLLSTYISTGFDLTAASADFFVKYVESEMANGYQRPAYPHKFWRDIFRRNGVLEANFAEKVGYNRPETQVFAKDFCADLTLLRSRLDNFRKFYNFTEEMKDINDDFEKIDSYHIRQYF